MDRDLYAALGVPSTSSEREIRHAFHELARKHHPDVAVGDPGAARKFIELSEAAETLLDPRRRAAYDRSRTPGTPASASPSPPPPAWTPPAWTAPADRRYNPAPRRAYRIFRITTGVFLTAAAVFWAVASILASPRHVADRNHGPGANGSVLWKAAGYRMDDGWGINLAGSGRRIQIYPGSSADLEVDSGYLSSAGRITFLPPGTAPSYQGCLHALGPANSQAEPLDSITPGARADLCALGSTGDIAFVRVTGKNGTSLIMDITIWHYI